MRAWHRPGSPVNPVNPTSTWMGRVLRGRRLDRNPLRRGSDRVESVVLAVLLAAFLAGAPFVAHAAGSWTYAASAREAQAQRAAFHHVPATLLQTATSWSVGPDGAGANARWRAPDGQPRTGYVIAPAGTPAGSTEMVWTDQTGQLTDPPLQNSQIAGRVVITQGLAVAVLAFVLMILSWAARWALERARLAAWDAEWLATGPRWSSRR